MALFGRKTASSPRSRGGGGNPVYWELRKPSLRTMQLPPMQLMQNDVDKTLVLALAKTANENLLTVLEGKTGGLSNDLDELLKHFSELLGEDHKGAVFIAPGIGYIIGMMENGSGSEVVGQSELHYVLALSVTQLELPDEATKSIYFDFIRDCGYYLARTRDASLQELCDIADEEVRWMETSGNR